jgi:hypothetical protein
VSGDTPLALPSTADPETVSTYVETLWHLADEEIAKTDSLEGKATALASLGGFIVAVNGAFGLGLVRSVGGLWWLAYTASLVALLLAVWYAALAIRPADHTVFGADYIRGLETEAELKQNPNAARLRVISLLIKRVLEERKVVKTKSERVIRAFYFLAAGLILVAVEATGLAGKLLA